MDKNLKPVIIHAESYKDIILHACKYANSAILEDEWKMVYGVLSGYSDDQFLYVKNAHPIAVGSAKEVSIKDQGYIKFGEIMEKLDSEGKGHFVIGSYHSKPGLSLFMSKVDLINHLGFQARFNDAITIVFDHTLLGTKKEEKIDDNILTKFDTGFEIYRLTEVKLDRNSDEYETNYHKIDYVVEGLNKFFFADVLATLSAKLSEE